MAAPKKRLIAMVAPKPLPKPADQMTHQDWLDHTADEYDQIAAAMRKAGVPVPDDDDK